MGNRNKQYIKDLVVAVIITCSPFLIYSHLLYSNEIKSIIIFGHEVQHGFKSQEHFVWYSMIKLLPVLLLSIWYLTTRFDWKYYILIPIVLYLDSLIRFSLMPPNSPDPSYFIISVYINCLFIGILMITSKLYMLLYGSYIKSAELSKILTNYSKNHFYEVINIIKDVKGFNKWNNGKYFQNLFHLKNYIEEKLVSINDIEEKSTLTKKGRRILIGLFVLMPLLFNIHHMIPIDKMSMKLLFFNLNSHGFPSVNILVWLFFVKLTFLLSIAIWFTTCQYWWKYAILSPIILVTYQIWEMFQDVRYIDAWGNLKALPVILFVVLTLVIISNSIKYEFKVSDLHKAITIELDGLIATKAEQEEIAVYKEKLNAIKSASCRGNGEKGQDLKALMELREALMRDLDVNA